MTTKTPPQVAHGTPKFNLTTEVPYSFGKTLREENEGAFLAIYYYLSSLRPMGGGVRSKRLEQPGLWLSHCSEHLPDLSLN